jgi:hypothetical protein
LSLYYYQHCTISIVVPIRQLQCLVLYTCITPQNRFHSLSIPTTCKENPCLCFIATQRRDISTDSLPLKHLEQAHLLMLQPFLYVGILPTCSSSQQRKQPIYCSTIFFGNEEPRMGAT